MSLKLELCNRALLGISNMTLSSLRDTSLTAYYTFAAYNNAFETLNAEHRFSFLVRDIKLENPSLVEDPNGKFRYKFLVPENFERLIGFQTDPFEFTDILLASLYKTPLTLDKFQYRGDGFIWSNYSSIYILYLLSELEDFTKVSSGFKQAMIKLMKAELAISIQKSPTLEQSFLLQAITATRKAISNDIDQTKTLVEKLEDPVRERNPRGNFREF